MDISEIDQSFLLLVRLLQLQSIIQKAMTF
jgi:hypothetical protein